MLSTHKLHHSVADVSIKVHSHINVTDLLQEIRKVLDQYYDDESILADAVLADIRNRPDYNSPGYNLRVYRHRADLTQAQLAKLLNIKQHHLSEMEHNKRSIGKKSAHAIAKVLNCDYKELL